MDTIVALLTDPALVGPDGMDPVIVILNIALTALITRYAPAALVERLKPWLPLFILALSVGLRAAGDAVVGDPVTIESVTRGIAAAGVAIMGHAQVRALIKARVERADIEDMPQGDNP